MAKIRLQSFAIAFALMLSYPIFGICDNTLQAQTNTNVFSGEVEKMGNGVIWSWITVDPKGNPSSLGVTFTETALSGLSENIQSGLPYPTIEYALALPANVRVVPYTHIVVNWNPHGHIPSGIFDAPHFDFHFYMISPDERYRITAKGEDIAKCNKKLPAQFVPSGYILPEGTQEPRMGSHWIDPSSPEFNKQPFTNTFVYGSYNGEMAFLEPMVSKDFLETKPDVTAKIKLPQEFERHGFYPTAYRVEYDPMRKEYSISLVGLTYR